MTNEIIIDVSMGQTRVALLENKELVELYIESPDHQEMVGNIYRGKVVSVLPGMQAAFVDIGYEKNAFLYIKDIIIPDERKDRLTDSTGITDLVGIGQDITVQVIKEPIGTKGPRVTTNLTLPGRHVVFLPYCDYVGVSKRIGDETERQRLKEVAQSIKPKEAGLIIRTQGEGKEAEDFICELNFLLKLWQSLQAKGAFISPVPGVIHRDFDLLFRTVRDLFTWNIHRFVISDAQRYTKVLELLDMLSPALKERVEYFSKDYDIFEYYQIENKISKILEKKIWLKCGGYIVIDRTEALTAIDVNTGKYVGESDLEDTVLKTNLEAAKEVAKQLRLRDIGGIIIIDFIDMHVQKHREQVIDTLKHYLKKDKTKTMVAGTTYLGLVEMTRKKVRERLTSLLKIECPCCHGVGEILAPETVVRLAEKDIYKVFNQSVAAAIEVKLHPRVARLLAGADGANIKRLEDVFHKKIVVKYCEHFNLDQIVIKAIEPKECKA